jgi:hypothetical protein
MEFLESLSDLNRLEAMVDAGGSDNDGAWHGLALVYRERSLDQARAQFPGDRDGSGSYLDSRGAGAGRVNVQGLQPGATMKHMQTSDGHWIHVLSARDVAGNLGGKP